PPLLLNRANRPFHCNSYMMHDLHDTSAGYACHCGKRKCRYMLAKKIFPPIAMRGSLSRIVLSFFQLHLERAVGCLSA
ncbi:MAG: hypothetical protein QGF59_21360, partial [Pirellulaceae bacterium]|nr:hypothetical protein [Pirellulaceae bacterium]